MKEQPPARQRTAGNIDAPANSTFGHETKAGKRIQWGRGKVPVYSSPATPPHSNCRTNRPGIGFSTPYCSLREYCGIIGCQFVHQPGRVYYLKGGDGEPQHAINHGEANDYRTRDTHNPGRTVIPHLRKFSSSAPPCRPICKLLVKKAICNPPLPLPGMGVEPTRRLLSKGF